MGDFTLETSPPSKETLAFAEKELRETPENIKKGLKELRELLQNDGTIYFNDEDKDLLIFLRPCKFYAKSAFELMKRIAQFKETYRSTLENLLPEDEKEAIDNFNIVNVLKNRDDKGRRVLLFNCGKCWDPSKVTDSQVFRIFYLMHEAALLEPETQIKGVVVIMDFDDLGIRQFAMPLRLKEVHMVKQSFLFNLAWQAAKPFVRYKLRNRIYFHGGDMTTLHKHIDPSTLPQDYDGKLPKINYTGKDWYPVINSVVDHIKKMNMFGFMKKN